MVPAGAADRVESTVDHRVVDADILSMPDKWEYPWYAAWDLAFHACPCTRRFRLRQGAAGLFLREWYMHPNGQIPAYEWAFGDVNPPVHAWAALARLQDRKETRGESAIGRSSKKSFTS